MSQVLLDKIKEAILAVLPISLIVLVLNFTILPLPYGGLTMFLTSVFLLIIGIILFTTGAEIAMMPIGESVGSYLTSTKKIWFVILTCFIIGIMVTIAEPDVQVLATQVEVLPSMTLILCIGVGSGIFFVVALLRMLFKIKISYILIICYTLIFILGSFTSEEFLALSFDASGVSTGSISVPFLLALGASLSAVRGSKSAHDKSFGLFAICSIGPIFVVLLMGMLSQNPSTGYQVTTLPIIQNLKEVITLFIIAIPSFAKEVLISLIPIIIFFIIFQLFALKLTKHKLQKIVIGIIYTFVGLILFLTSVNVGFMPIGNYIGYELVASNYSWILLPLSTIIGFVIVAAEPAVQVLNKQVEEITGGAISRKLMLIALSIGVALSLIISMYRIIFDISIWYFLLPGYIITLILAVSVPEIFTAIAFDSGGIASGTMSAAFLLPFAIGICESIGRNPVKYAFGIIALIAMMPIISIQIVGLIYKIRVKHAEKELEQAISQTQKETTTDTEIINVKE